VRRFSETSRTRVMSRGSAQRIGSVARFLVDPGTHRIVALQVAKDLLVDWEGVRGVGDDAVVVEDEGRLRGPADDREERAIRGKLDLRGKLVLTDGGNGAGQVTDVEFDERTGTLETVVTTTGRIPADRIRALGSYCLVVREEAHDPL
jgi:sporulation protein YlmC with PRC-barrel domain